MIMLESQNRKRNIKKYHCGEDLVGIRKKYSKADCSSTISFKKTRRVNDRSREDILTDIWN